MSSNYIDDIKEILAAARANSNQSFKQSERDDVSRLQVEPQFPHQESGKYKSDCNDFQDLRQCEDKPTSFQQTRGFGDRARDYLCTNTQEYSDRSWNFDYGSEYDPMKKHENLRYDYNQKYNDSQRWFQNWSHTKESQMDLRFPSQTNSKKQYGDFHQGDMRIGTTEQREHRMAHHPVNDQGKVFNVICLPFCIASR